MLDEPCREPGGGGTRQVNRLKYTYEQQAENGCSL